VISQVNASTRVALPLAYSLLSSLVVVRRRAEAPRDGRWHRVWRGGLVRPCPVRSAVRGRRCSVAGLVPQVHVRSRDSATMMAQALTVLLEPSFVPFWFCMTVVADLESVMSAG